MGRRGDDVSVLHRVLQQASCDQTSRVSHIDQQDGTYCVGDLAHALVVPLTAVGRTTTDDQLRLVLQGQLLHLVVVHAARLAAEVIADVVVENTRRVYSATVREVAALIEVQAHEGVARLQDGEQYSLVGLCTRVGLHVDKLSAEELLHAVDGEVLHLVHHLATAIVALAGITLGIFVGEV